MAKEKPRRDDPTGADSFQCCTDCLAELLLKRNRIGRCQVLEDAKSWVCSEVPAKMMCLKVQGQRYFSGFAPRRRSIRQIKSHAVPVPGSLGGMERG
ncbi:hypothetical protein E5S70_17530 [Ensifer adhaerens]|uniref:hypothetical protein n=1 Tax=Ensifer canadensis TaxID=555315 RepID=UPI001490515F|nr:hypothetical protein [Ensifer canadensis]NOV17855.1 hypothetical protein [Ensifer canadensis]